MIKIVSDFHAGLSAEIIEQHDITLVPAYVKFGNDVLQEGVDFTVSEFYQMLQHADDFPETIPPTVDAYAATFDDILSQHPRATILTVQFSSAMSEMYERATQAAEQFNGAVHTFDSQSVSVPEALMVIEAAEMAASHAALPDILARLRAIRQEARLFFVLDTLDYLEKGGRIGRAASLVGKVMNTKPVLTLQDGAVTSYARFTEREAALKNLKSVLLHVARDQPRVRMGVAHAACPDDAAALADDLQAAIDPEICLVGEVSPAVGANTGPGALALGWWVPG